jgi:hypothetical protein
MKPEQSQFCSESILTSIVPALIYGLLVVSLFVPCFAAYPQERVSIAINAAASIDGLPKEQIFALRKSEVQKHKELGIFPKNYEPSWRVFGRVLDRADWVKDVRFFINNPYLLVLNSSHPYVNVLTPYCDVTAVTYLEGKITELYRGEVAKKWFYYIYDHYKQNNEIIRLWFANAYDAGFRFAHIDKDRSLNVDLKRKNSQDSVVNGVYSGNEFFHFGHLDKNNISPFDERATLRLITRDTKTVVYIKLWKNRPASREAPEDFAYIIRMEP